MHRYEYTSEQWGTYIRCHPRSQTQQRQMLEQLIDQGLDIIEKYSKERKLWDNNFKMFRKVLKKDGAYTKGTRMQPSYKTVFNERSIQLQNSGDYGYDKSIKQSPFEIIAGECRKFYRVIQSDHQHLSPTQIELWNKAIDTSIAQIQKIMNDIYMGPNWETRDLPRLEASEMAKLLQQLQNMKIDGVDTEKQKMQQQDQITINNTAVIENIE